MKIEDGGPAFPTETEAQTGMHTYRLTGMSLRDYFAGQALAGFVAMYAHPQAIGQPSPEESAAAAYGYADAMLAARVPTDTEEG